MEYKIEDCKLYNERKYGSPIINGCFIYSIEHSFSMEEKIKFIDDNYEWNGHKCSASYMLNLIDKFHAEKDSLPKDSFGKVKTVSLKSWLKKNDSWRMIDNHYYYGAYYFANRDYLDFRSLLPKLKYNTGNIHYNNCIDLWFHDVLDILVDKEEKYFKDHDSMIIKVRKIRDYGNMYGSFNIEKIAYIVLNGESVLDDNWIRTFNRSVLTEEELDKILKVYEDLDKIVKTKTKEIQDSLGWKVFED